MYARRQPLLIGDARKEIDELRALCGREGCARCLVVGSRDAPDLAHRLLPFGRQVQRIDAPILGVIATLDEPAFLELVDEDDQPARKDRERPRERLLTEPRARRDRAQDAGVRPRQLERGEPFAEPGRRVIADLRQEERRRTGAARRLRSGVFFSRHATDDSERASYALHIVHVMNDS